MMTLEELRIYMNERDSVCKELTKDEVRYFMNTHRVFARPKYKDEVCKFTGRVFELYDYICEQRIGYIVEYKTSSGKKVFIQHRL